MSNIVGLSRYPKTLTIPVSIGLLGVLGNACSAADDASENVARVNQAVTSALAPELPAASIPKFQTQLQRFFDYVPSLTRNSQGQVTRKEFTVEIAKFQA